MLRFLLECSRLLVGKRGGGGGVWGRLSTLIGLRKELAGTHVLIIDCVLAAGLMQRSTRHERRPLILILVLLPITLSFTFDNDTVLLDAELLEQTTIGGKKRMSL